MTLDAFVQRAVGVPFAPGYDFTGWHCWGLVVAAYREVLGVDLPRHADVSVHERLRIARRMAHGEACFGRVDAPAPLDVIVMGLHSGRRFGHVGLADGQGHVLHVEEASHTVLEPLDSPLIRGRVRGVFRHV